MRLLLHVLTTANGTFCTWGGRSVAGSLQIRTNGAMALLTQPGECGPIAMQQADAVCAENW